MRSIILISVLCLQLGWSYVMYSRPHIKRNSLTLRPPLVGESSSAGSFSYGDTSGNRYGGTYGSNPRGFAGVGFFPPFMQSFWSDDDFFPDYFSNLQVLLNEYGLSLQVGAQSFRWRVTFERTATSTGLEPLPPLPPLPGFRPFRPLPPLRPLRPFRPFRPFPRIHPFPPLEFGRAFESNLENQRRAYTAARKAFDLTSNQAGYIPNLTSRFSDRGGFGGFGAFPGFPMQGHGANSAFAGGAVGPDFTHQVAAINPKNPHVPNVNVVNRFSDTARGGDNDFYSVSSSSFVSSSNVDGKEKSHRKAETVVNRNGEISQFKVED